MNVLLTISDICSLLLPVFLCFLVVALTATVISFKPMIVKLFKDVHDIATILDDIDRKLGR